MSKWTAKVTNKTLKDGQLRVDLEYTNGSSSFRDSMITRCKQDDDWILREVSKKCDDLDALDEFFFKIEIGDVNIGQYAVKEPATIYSANKKAYADELKKLRQWGEAFRHGIAVTDHASFSDLKKWLQDNFDPDYLDLF